MLVHVCELMSGIPGGVTRWRKSSCLTNTAKRARHFVMERSLVTMEHAHSPEVPVYNCTSLLSPFSRLSFLRAAAHLETFFFLHSSMGRGQCYCSLRNQFLLFTVPWLGSTLGHLVKRACTLCKPVWSGDTLFVLTNAEIGKVRQSSTFPPRSSVRCWCCPILEVM